MSDFIKNLTAKKILNLKQEIPINNHLVVSKTLVQQLHVGMTLFSLDKDESISAHKATGDALVYLLSGHAKITLDGEDFNVSEGESLLMPAGVPHALYAETAFQMLLIVVK
ncbi:cupin domain-containing protein [Sporolactobacillus shoreicorticis]|uniref:Cupin domain-containing protein n=1 Tax=Sporolactobacillus shoreicorticis TaxID=1923877 RepID=A0ABW5S0Y4_9BACL|nr:cupin domain-containing protein [Sporolactobacillus shoreicorticis]MCO7127590.1 cupin domain-containing protein [Sporolactobacillus shoreicorticis]